MSRYAAPRVEHVNVIYREWQALTLVGNEQSMLILSEL